MNSLSKYSILSVKLLILYIPFSSSIVKQSIWKVSTPKYPSTKFYRSLSNVFLSENDESTSLEAIDIINSFIIRDKASGVIQAKVDMKSLIDSGYILAKGKAFEEAIEQKINSCGSKEELDAVNNLNKELRQFVENERKSRARMKLTYILAGASSNRLEVAFESLSASDEIDDALLSYTESLIKREQLRGGGPMAGLESKYDPRVKLGSTTEKTLEILQIIRNRILAELQLKMDGRQELKLLAKLIAENNPNIRKETLKIYLERIEDVNNFRMILEDAIQYARQSSKSDTASSPETAAPSIKSSNKPIFGLLERLKDVEVSLNELTTALRTGLRNQDDLFSTSPEDYMPKKELP